jgi:hypothetical protein
MSKQWIVLGRGSVLGGALRKARFSEFGELTLIEPSDTCVLSVGEGAYGQETSRASSA